MSTNQTDPWWVGHPDPLCSPLAWHNEEDWQAFLREGVTTPAEVAARACAELRAHPETVTRLIHVEVANPRHTQAVAESVAWALDPARLAGPALPGDDVSRTATLAWIRRRGTTAMVELVAGLWTEYDTVLLRELGEEDLVTRVDLGLDPEEWL